VELLLKSSFKNIISCKFHYEFLDFQPEIQKRISIGIRDTLQSSELEDRGFAVKMFYKLSNTNRLHYYYDELILMKNCRSNLLY
jgi:hypothetical protein